MAAEKQDRGVLRIDAEECKGCGLCIEACPPKVIGMNERLNHYGYRTAFYAGSGCTGCGICFLVCPEPGAITVYRAVRKEESAGVAVSPVPKGEGPGAPNVSHLVNNEGPGAPDISHLVKGEGPGAPNIPHLAKGEGPGAPAETIGVPTGTKGAVSCASN